MTKTQLSNRLREQTVKKSIYEEQSKRSQTTPLVSSSSFSMHAQQICSEVVSVADSHTKQIVEANVSSKSTMTERLKAAVTDDCEIASPKMQKVQNNLIGNEESLESIEEYMNTIFSGEILIQKRNTKISTDGSTQEQSAESLIGILSEKQERIDTNQVKESTQMATRSQTINKLSMSSINVNDDNSSPDESETDEEQYGTTFIDENDKTRFICMRENGMANGHTKKSKTQCNRTNCHQNKKSGCTSRKINSVFRSK